MPQNQNRMKTCSNSNRMALRNVDSKNETEHSFHEFLFVRCHSTAKNALVMVEVIVILLLFGIRSNYLQFITRTIEFIPLL